MLCWSEKKDEKEKKEGYDCDVHVDNFESSNQSIWRKEDGKIERKRDSEKEIVKIFIETRSGLEPKWRNKARERVSGAEVSKIYK